MCITMPIDRTPPKIETASSTLRISLCAKLDQFTVTFHDILDSFESSDSTMSEIKSMLLQLRRQQEKNI